MDMKTEQLVEMVCNKGIREFEEDIKERQNEGYQPKFESFRVSESLDDGRTTSWYHILMVKIQVK